MTTPTKERIRERATELFNNSNRHLPSISPEDSELRENGLWFEARNELMRNTARSQQLSYVEEMAHELGFELKKENPSEVEKRFANGEKYKESLETESLQFDVKEAMRSGIFVSGTSGSGKTNLCFHIAERLMQHGIIVYVLDPSQAWRNSSISETITIPQVNKPTQINWKAESTIFDISLLYVKSQRKFTELFCGEIFNKAVHGFKPKVFIMFEDAQIYLPNHVLRSNAAQEILRLITCGRNYNIRFGLITQFASMVDKTCVKMCKQRYFGFTNEKNDIAYLKAFLGDRTSELETLEVGQFLYDYSKTTKRISVSLFNKAAKQNSWLTYQHTSLGDY